MYHACEATNLEVTLDLRTNLGVPWTLHTWLQTLTTANDNNLVAIINEILQVILAFSCLRGIGSNFEDAFILGFFNLLGRRAVGSFCGRWASTTLLNIQD